MYKLLTLLVLLAACSPSTKKSSAVKASHQKKDTVFLRRERSKNFYAKVFVEQDRHSKWYKNLLDFTYDEFDAKSYGEAYQLLKKHHPRPLEIYDRGDLAGEWMPVYRYQGKYYIYSPSEWGNTERRIITDSTMVYWTMEGPSPQAIQAFSKISSGSYDIKTGSADGKVKASHLRLHIIDPINEISVWEDLAETGAYRYGLYIPRNKAAKLDLVVADCAQGKTMEFEFDKIDYPALLRAKTP